MQLFRAYRKFFLLRFPFAWATGLHYVLLFAGAIVALAIVAKLAPSEFWFQLLRDLVDMGRKCFKEGPYWDLYCPTISFRRNADNIMDALKSFPPFLAALWAVWLSWRYAPRRVEVERFRDFWRRAAVLILAASAICFSVEILRQSLGRAFYDALLDVGIRHYDIQQAISISCYRWACYKELFWESAGLSAVCGLLAYPLLYMSAFRAVICAAVASGFYYCVGWFLVGSHFGENAFKMRWFESVQFFHALVVIIPLILVFITRISRKRRINAFQYYGMFTLVIATTMFIGKISSGGLEYNQYLSVMLFVTVLHFIFARLNSVPRS